MRVVESGPYSARCEARGALRDVSLLMLAGEPVEPGEYVLVQMGHVVQKVSAEEAASVWEVLDLMLPEEHRPQTSEALEEA